MDNCRENVYLSLNISVQRPEIESPFEMVCKERNNENHDDLSKLLYIFTFITHCVLTAGLKAQIEINFHKMLSEFLNAHSYIKPYS